MLTKCFLLVFVFSVFTATAKAQDFVSMVKGTLDYYGIPATQSLLQQYREARGVTPEYIEGYSWLARKELVDHQLGDAEKYAGETYSMCVEELKHRALDVEPHLPIALGAAIEVHGLAMAEAGNRAKALTYLQGQLAKYGDTSIAERISKNINTISLVGRPAPALIESEHLGPKPLPLTAYHGKPVLLFFWAHWCVDCKAEAPILARLKQEYGNKLIIVAPTRRYGYAAAGDPASPVAELKYIEEVREKYYSRLGDTPVPVSAENFKHYGASTTPTLVLVGTDGRVKLYHPGRMTYEELKGALATLGLT